MSKSKFISKKNRKKIKRRKRIIRFVFVTLLRFVFVTLLISITFLANKDINISQENKEDTTDSNNVSSEVKNEEIKNIRIRVFNEDEKLGWKEKNINKKEDIKAITEKIEQINLSNEFPGVLYDFGIVVEYTKNEEKMKYVFLQGKVLTNNVYYEVPSNLYGEILEMYKNFNYKENIL